MGSADTEYQLGHEADELERLNVQGRALAATTRTLVEAAGLRAGMRVLDLGSGAGDMSFVAADVVGAHGEVVGIERAPEAVAQASAPARRRALVNTRFVSGDIHEAVDDGPFDAVVGRLVLMYVPDPSAVLHTQAAALRRGGIVAPIEFDLDPARTIPATPLASRALTWVLAAFEQAGIQGALGPRLWQILAGAGLKPVGMTSIQPHFGPDDPDGHALLAGDREDAAAGDRADWRSDRRRGRRRHAGAKAGRELVAAQAVFAHPALTCAWAVV